MTAKEVREKYIKFFESSPRSHKQIPPAPLVLETDSTTLFTSAGMQPLIPYLKGEPHPEGKRLVNSQPSIRLQDIEEVGDRNHTTFFEMLGNWSLGNYFKKEQISWIYEFFTQELHLDKERLYVSVFEGNKDVPKDEETYQIWKKLGIPDERIYFYGVDKNWWSLTGEPKNMPVGEIGGPDSEIFYEFPQVEHDKKYGEKCHPNCQCGRFLEIGNCVFIQYEKVENGLKELPQKNVDFGGGLERITAAVNNESDIFRTDIYKSIIDSVAEKYSVSYGSNEEVDRNIRIIADHMRAACAIISNGIFPSNKGHGYVLRRLIRRSARYARKLSPNKHVSLPVINYPEIETKEPARIIEEETQKFSKTLNLGLKEIDKMEKLDGKTAFYLYESYGFPLELTEEVAEERGQKIDKKIFESEFKKHKELSRTTSAGVFKGGLADHSQDVIKLHTATHLLLASLRRVLGDHVVQKGQNITRERSRFDFPNPDKLTEEQLAKVEENINQIIDMDLPVNFKVMPKEEALKTGAIHAFNEKYTETVKVYYVGDSLESAFSKEFCGGPHVEKTSQIGHVKINKQEKIGNGLIRIYLIVEQTK